VGNSDLIEGSLLQPGTEYTYPGEVGKIDDAIRSVSKSQAQAKI
jgi:hypothetical protein